MYIFMKRLFICIVFAIFLSASVDISYAQEPLYFGMSEGHFETCKKLGKQIMDAQRAQPDSTEHKRAYNAWDQSCGVKVMLDLSRKYKLKKIPTSPQEWAVMN